MGQTHLTNHPEETYTSAENSKLCLQSPGRKMKVSSLLKLILCLDLAHVWKGGRKQCEHLTGAGNLCPLLTSQRADAQTSVLWDKFSNKRRNQENVKCGVFLLLGLTWQDRDKY